MSDPRWTEETENLVAMELEDVLPRDVGALPDEAFYEDARKVLHALADAGLLVEPGSDMGEEWAVRHRVVGETAVGGLRDGDMVQMAYSNRDAASAAFDLLAEVWAHHPRLLRRTVHTGPWREAS